MNITSIKYEELYRSIIAASPDGITILDPSGAITYASPKSYEMFGLVNQSEVTGHPALEFVSPPDRERFARELTGFLQNPDQKTRQFTFLKKGGEPFEVEINGAVLRDGKGGLLGVMGFLRDVSQRMRAEAEQRESERLYRSLFEAMLEGYAYCKMIFTDGKPVDFTYITVNSAFEKLTGLKDVVGKNVTEIIPGIRESNPELFEIYGRVALTGQPARFETYLPALDIWFSISVYRPEESAFVATFHNITERKQAEDEIRKLNSDLERRVAERTAELSDLYNNAPCGYHSLDENGWYVRVNDTELRWLGYTRDELVGRMKVTDLYTPTSVEIFNINYPILKERGWVSDLEIELVRKDGSILPVLLNATAVKDGQGRFLMTRTTIVDLTDRKRAQATQQALVKSLAMRSIEVEAANADLEAFVYSVSHDLRAPLRRIEGFSTILMEDHASQMDQETTRLLDIIHNNTQKMNQLITDLLQLSRIGRDELHASQVNMVSLVNSVYDEVAGAETKRQFEFTVKDLPPAAGDQALLRQVWINLISNAIKYTRPKTEKRIEVGGYPLLGKVAFYVKDSGVGFDPEYADKLFTVFQRLHLESEFEGDGVGLAIVKRIVTRHHGQVWAEGQVGQGATFYFSLPA